jgi:thioredoxin 1
MISRRFLLTAAFAFATMSTSALAAEKQPFTPQAFAAAQSAGQSILIDIDAPWCPTCKAQAPILQKLESQPKFKGLRVFRVDFDSQKDAVRSFRATSQSTLIVFKGATETGRTVGDTDPASIAALLEKSL